MPDELAIEDPGPDAFVDRHIGPRAAEQATRLHARPS